MAGLPPGSAEAGAFTTALADYFTNNSVIYDIGGVTTTTGVSEYLQRASFDFVAQANPEIPGDGCILLLIEASKGMGGGVSAPWPATRSLTVTQRHFLFLTKRCLTVYSHHSFPPPLGLSLRLQSHLWDFIRWQ
ncbi:hypothetical protein PGN61_22770 [Klebsiella aerogenes]